MPTTEIPIEFNGFKGLNLRESPAMIAEDELSECINFNIGKAGELIKRPGFSVLHTGETLGVYPVKIIGHFFTPVYSQILVVSGGMLYYTENGSDFSLIGPYAVEFGVQHVDRFYMVRQNGNVLVWDGTKNQETLPYSQRSFEESVGGWANEVNTLVAISGTFETEGVSALKLSALAAGDMWAVGPRFDTGVGRTLTLSAKLRGTIAKNAVFYLRYFDAAGTLLATHTGISTAISTTGFTTVTTSHTMTDSTVAEAQIALKIIGAAAVNDSWYMDELSVKTDGPVSIEDSPHGTFCAVFKDRLYIVNSNAPGLENSHLVFSDLIIDPAEITFPSTNVIPVAAGDGDFLTCVAAIQDVLFVFKGTSTKMLFVEGPPENWELRESNNSIGCLSKYTPKTIENAVYFVSGKGVYRTDGTTYDFISKPLQSVIQDRIVNLATANVDSAEWWDDKYIVLFHLTPSDLRYFVFHVRTEMWTEWVPSEGITPGTFTALDTALPTKGLYCGDTSPTGKIFRMTGQSFTDSGVAYPCSFKTKDFDFGTPAFSKRGKWLSADTQGDAAVEWTHTVDQDELNPVIVNSMIKRRAMKFRGPGYFRTWTLRGCLTSSSEFILYKLTLVLHGKSKIQSRST